MALKTSAIDYNGRFCMSSSATAGNRAFGVDRGLPFPLSDIANAAAILLVGANPADTMPPAMQYFDEGRAAGAQHIVVDPRRTSTADGASMHLAPIPGTDLALANGLLHIAIRDGYLDEAYIAERTTGFEAVEAAVASYWPDWVERITGVSVGQLRETVRILAQAPSAMILTARGAEQHSNGTDTAQAFINLALALGLPGKHASGYGTITGQGNGQGGREHGQKADQLPGYRRLDDPKAREHVAKVWGIDPKELPLPGKSAFEMLDRLGSDGGVRALLVLASNIVVSAPDANRVRSRLGALDLLVVSDIFLSETAAIADVVLPTAQWAEEDGTMTNVEGRVIRRKQALPPPVGVLDDLQMLTELAAQTRPRAVLLGRSAGRLRRAAAGQRRRHRRLRRASATSGSTPRRASSGRVPTTDHPGTPRMFAERFATPDGRARFHRVLHKAPAETPDAKYPYVLTTGRLMTQYQSGTQTRRLKGTMVPRPARADPPGPGRAGSEIAASDLVELRTRRGAAVFRAQLSDAIRPEVLFVPFHWGGASNANSLTDPALDPLSKMPEFKACAVSLSRIGGPDDVAPADRHPRPARRSALRRPAAPDHRTATSAAAPPIPPDDNEGRPHAHEESFPARHLPVHRSRHRQAGAAGRAAELRRAGRLGGAGAVLPRRQHRRRIGHPGPDAGRGADAVLPDGRQVRCARAAAGRRGPRGRHRDRAVPRRARGADRLGHRRRRPRGGLMTHPRRPTRRIRGRHSSRRR